MPPPQFVIDDDDENSGLKSPRRSQDQGRYSEDSIDESGLNREYFEKDERFRDEAKMEQGGEGDDNERGDRGFRGDGEDDGFIYGKIPARKQNRRPFLVVLLVILAISAVIGVLAGRSFKAPTYISRQGNKHITMDHIFNGTFSVKSKRLDWVEEAMDGIYSHRTDEGNIILQDANDVEYEQVLLNASDVKEATGNQLFFQNWKLSADMQYVLLKTDHRKLWRHSSYGNYYIHRLSDHVTFPLHRPSFPSETAYVEWSPTGHSLAYVRQNDLYVVTAGEVDQLSTAGQAPDAIRVTDDGNANIFNGVPDWVYEEEVFEANNALWWSPGSDEIAFLHFDETEVKNYTLQYYAPSGSAFEVVPYPEPFVMKYPKPGTPNPIVTLHSFSLQAHLAGADRSETLKHLIWSGELPGDDRIITEVSWVGADALLVKETNRSAKRGHVVLFQGGDPIGRVVRNQGKDGEGDDGGWIEHSQKAIRFEGAASGYLDVVPNADGYNHIALFSPIESSEPLFITSGEWEVAGGIAGIDHEKGIVYFLAANPSTERHVYQAMLPGTEEEMQDFQPQMEQITDTSKPGYFSASFSPKAGFYVLNYHGPNIPYQELFKAEDHDSSTILEDNAKLNETSAEYCFPIKSHTTVESDGQILNVVENLPPNFEASGRKKYPVLLNPYGGPGSQTASYRFIRDWHHYLVCEKKIIVLTVDGRGTGFKGRGFRNWVRDNLGKYETIDQVNAAREWAKRKYVDNDRIGIWGWSYGGFLTTKVIEADSGIFSLGMAVAPVTNWRYYDSIYTERYMSTVAENEYGYMTSAVNNVTAFNHANFLLAHGSGDDNVHYANTANLLEKFTQAAVRHFRFRMFTDSDHSMSGYGAYRELFEFLTEFLDEKWGKKTSV